MNAKLKKVLSDMKKIEGKMELLKEKWEELNKQKTELENLAIIGLIRGAKKQHRKFKRSDYGIPQ